jgi:hypothetical protein
LYNISRTISHCHPSQLHMLLPLFSSQISSFVSQVTHVVFSVAFIQKSTHLLVNFNLQKCHYLRKCYVNKYFELVIFFLKIVFMKLSAKFLLCRIIRLEKFKPTVLPFIQIRIWFGNFQTLTIPHRSICYFFMALVV